MAGEDTVQRRPRLIVLGRQGAGKGTQCSLLAEKLQVPHVSTGDLLRAEVAARTELGREVRSYLDTGSLVPDSLMLDLVGQRLGTDEARSAGYLIDGFPRTLAQGRALFDVLGSDAIDIAVEIDVPANVVRPRLASRRVCRRCNRITSVQPGAAPAQPCPACGGTLVRRQDDNDAAIERRLALYDEQSGPLLVWLDSRNLLVTVDGVGDPAVVQRRVLDALLEVLPDAAGSAMSTGGLLDSA